MKRDTAYSVAILTLVVIGAAIVVYLVNNL